VFERSNDLTPYLSPGERVVWEGRSRRPVSSASTGGAIFLAIFVAISILMLVIFAAAGPRVGRDDTIAFVIIPVILLAVGLGVGIPLIVYGRQISRARYVVTSAAAIILSEGNWIGKRVTVVPLKNIQQVALTENRDGTGSLVFGQNAYAAGSRYGGWWSDTTSAFWNIDRPLEVYQLIRRQMAAE
jgi:hypothetical protein